MMMAWLHGSNDGYARLIKKNCKKKIAVIIIRWEMIHLFFGF